MRGWLAGFWWWRSGAEETASEQAEVIELGFPVVVSEVTGLLNAQQRALLDTGSGERLRRWVEDAESSLGFTPYAIFRD